MSELAKAYEAMKLPVQFITIPGAKHGGTAFYDEERVGIMVKFLLSHLRQQ